MTGYVVNPGAVGDPSQTPIVRLVTGPDTPPPAHLRGYDAELWAENQRLEAELEEARAEVERLRAKLDQPCGNCHPCTNWPAETWRQAGERLPDVHRYREMRQELLAAQDAVERLTAEVERRACGEQPATGGPDGQ